MAYAISKNSLKALNVFYFVVSIIMIAVAGAAKGMAKLSSPAVAGGVIACGVFLMLISIIGFVGAHKHHQVLLFIYMIVLGLLFVIQFSVSIACLAVSTDQQNDLVRQAWLSLSPESRSDIQNWGVCCGFNIATGQYVTKDNPITDYLGPAANIDPSVPVLCPCSDGSNGGIPSNPVCTDSLNSTVGMDGTGFSTHDTRGPSCMEKLQDDLDKGFKAAGGVGLFFSFTELLGVIAAAKFRTSLKNNQNNYA